MSDLPPPPPPPGGGIPPPPLPPGNVAAVEPSPSAPVELDVAPPAAEEDPLPDRAVAGDAVRLVEDITDRDELALPLAPEFDAIVSPMLEDEEPPFPPLLD